MLKLTNSLELRSILNFFAFVIIVNSYRTPVSNFNINLLQYSYRTPTSILSKYFFWNMK